MSQEPAPRTTHDHAAGAHVPKHLQEHAPTVIHDPDQDQTLLYKWMKRQLEKGPWLWVGVAIATTLASLLWIMFSGRTTARSVDAEAWNELIAAQGGDSLVKTAEQIATKTPGPVAGWALLKAAEARYNEAFDDLPANREAAMPLLGQARDFFRRSIDLSGKDVTLRRMAMLGHARVLEARGEVGEAIQEYKKVATAYPDSPEGKRAAKLQEALEKPGAVAFYEKFASFKPTPIGGGTSGGGFTLPPGGSSSINLPGLPPLTGPASGSSSSPLNSLGAGPSGTGTGAMTPPVSPPVPVELPTVIETPAPASPPIEAPKPAEPAKGELPKDPFAAPAPAPPPG
jgi:hypothetical protein